MRVLLISANTERLNMPTMPLGLALVAEAARRHEHDVAFLDLMFADDPVAAVRRALGASPQVIGISVRNIDDQAMEGSRLLLEQVRPVVELCRSSSDAPIVLGGAGYSIFPAEALAYLGADFGVAGDGESAFPALLGRLQRGVDPGDLPGVHVAGRPGAVAPPRRPDLAGLPLTADDWLTSVDPATPDLWVPVQSRRGCANDCIYCSTSRIEGRLVRCRSPRSVADEMARIARRGFRRFFVVDNSFNIPRSHAMELSRCIEAAGLGIEWRCILYPHRVDAELVRQMADAGCVEVSLGFESGDAGILRSLNKRFTPRDVQLLSDLLRDHGIRRMGFLLLGGPGETRQTVEESLAFADALQLDRLRTTVGIRIYPGTALAERAVAVGIVDPGDDLLKPRFYLEPGLEHWIRQRVEPGVKF